MRARDQSNEILILIWSDGERAVIDEDLSARAGLEVIHRNCDTLILRTVSREREAVQPN
jgi:hypothetical protein